MRIFDNSSAAATVIVFAVIGAGAASCSGKAHENGVSGPTGSGGVVLGTGGANPTGSGGFDTSVWPPTGFGPAVQADVGAYSLGPEYVASAGVGGTGSGNPPSGSAGATGGCGTTLIGIVRDFTGHDDGGPRAGHPDFENYCCGDDKRIVTNTLGGDRKPVYRGNSVSTHGQPAFDQWYRNVSGVNLPYFIAIDFQETDPAHHIFSFHSSAFFPVDDQGFGNFGRDHNFHFTTELHTQFRYGGGETFTFTGDDDVFVYVNGHLGINLGGVHGAENASIDLDASAAEFGITTGNVYDLDFFQAERHTTESNFRIETTMDFVDCGTFVPEIT
jgi:fibro-slime domain-containing protein